MPDRFTSSRQSTTQLTLVINGVSDASLSVQMVESLPTALLIQPASVSPVLKSDLTITLPSDYAYPLNAADFTATLHSESDSSISKQLYVMNVNDSTKTLTIKFPGAASGNYWIQI